MFGLGKRKISEWHAARVFIGALIADVDEALPNIIESLREHRSIPSLPPDARETLFTAVFALELIGLSNIFPKEQAMRLRELSIEALVEATGDEKDKICSLVEEYERNFAKEPFFMKAPSWVLCKRLFPEQEPSPMMIVVFMEILLPLGGHWKRLKRRYKVGPGPYTLSPTFFIMAIKDIRSKL